MAGLESQAATARIRALLRSNVGTLKTLCPRVERYYYHRGTSAA